MADESIETSPFPILPEGCVANIISFTSPTDACRAAAVSLGVKFAAESDTVWERFLPPDYKNIVLRSTTPVSFSTKKQLYFLLCHSPLLLDGGNLSFRLSRSTGKKCYMLCARELKVTWIETPKYWKWTPLPESRFAEVAELLNVCWLDIRGMMQARMLSPNTNYAAYLVFNLSEEHYGLDCPSKASVKFVKEEGTEIGGETSTVYIVPPTHRRTMEGHRWVRLPVTNIDGRVPQRRTDGWLEIELGEFFIGEGDTHDIRIQLSQLGGHWKKGLMIEGIELRPKEAF